MLHPAAVAGTKAAVLGEACNRDADGGCTPSATGFAVFQSNVVVPSGPMTLNDAEVGMVTQSSGPVMVPRSTDQKPPGVWG